MKIKDIGHFKEFFEDGPSILGYFGRDNIEHKEKIVNYLNHGEMYAIAPGAAQDIFTGECIITLMMLTDGEWNWRSDISHYVEKYNLRLPEEFVAKVLKWDGGKFDVDIFAFDIAEKEFEYRY